MKITQEDKICIFKCSKFSKADIGSYKCVATNEVGTAECEAKVDGKLKILKYLTLYDKIKRIIICFTL